MPSHILPRAESQPRFLRRLFLRFRRAAALRHQRRRLASLDDHLLRDIGISRDAAEREAVRKGWDAPDHWTR